MIVRTSINEIKRDSSALKNMGIGKDALIKEWASTFFEKFEIKNDTVYPSMDELPGTAFIRNVPPYVKVKMIKPFSMLKDGVDTLYEVDDISNTVSTYRLIKRVTKEDDIDRLVDMGPMDGFEIKYYIEHDRRMVVYEHPKYGERVSLYGYVWLFSTFIYDGMEKSVKR